MPITNGNYVSPPWRDNVPPPIDETELQAISDTIVTSQILYGSGAPTTSTAGKVGQRYANTSTNPYTIYKLVSITSGSYNWTPETDPNANTAQPYSTSSSYSAGAYCVYDGTLYRARQNVTREAWTEEHWERVYIAEALCEHENNFGNPHAVSVAQTGGLRISNLASAENGETAVSAHSSGSYLTRNGYLYLVIADIQPGDELIEEENISEKTMGEEVSAQWPNMGSITLSTLWNGNNPYTQTVTVTGASPTEYSKVDLMLTAVQIESLIADGVNSLVIENNAGTLTAFAVGAAPSAAMTVACRVEETV